MKYLKWKYKEGFIISFGLLLLGFAMEFFLGNHKIKLSWPVNIYCALGFISLMGIINYYYRGHQIVKWLSSKYASVSIISTFSLLVLLIGFIPQSGSFANNAISRLGLNSLTSSWPFSIIILYFLSVLGFVILKKLTPLKRKNIGFLLNHTGLWVIAFAAGLGNGDFKRLVMEANLDNTVWHAFDRNNKTYEMPLAIRLIKFDIESYNPKIAVIDKVTGKISGKRNKNVSTIEKTKQIIMGEFNITINKFYKESYWFGSLFKPVEYTGAAPSALISVVNINSGDTIQGWITSGSYKLRAQSLQLDENNLLVMLSPEPRRFSSEVQVITKSGSRKRAIIEVNKPYKIMGWNLYQLGYNQKMGKWSEISIIELVRDPWLPVVYVGIFMLIAGAIFMFWQGKRILD
ncbi:MAG: cytochrome c biogenesis protein ResB [Bacteroidales bacterium]|nr:MAG: cytochrome c biogenesis protein ResB [Bacteroidales bacterium]